MADPFEGLDASFAGRLRGLQQACSIQVGSGYRSVERQQQLWDAAVKKYGSEAAARKWVAPPGKSNHNHGVAADLKGDLACAHQNAAKFGLRFPMGHEPWHIEPAGGKADRSGEAYTAPPDSDDPAPANRRGPADLIASFMDAILTGDNERNPVGATDDPNTGLRRSTRSQERTGRYMAGGASTPTAPMSDDEIGALAAAIKSVESGGDYQIVGKPTKYGTASGAYQWLDSTWASYGGFARAKDAPPEVQDRRAREDLQRLYDLYDGDVRRVAMHWHGGPNQEQWGAKTRKYADQVQGLI